jgi:hypothetical protein
MTWSDHFWAGCALLGVAVLLFALLLGGLWLADWIRWRPAAKGILRPRRRSLIRALLQWVAE